MRFPKPFSSLVPKLALIYLGLALLAALIMRAVVLTGELRALDRELERGWLAAATETSVARLGSELNGSRIGDAPALGRRLDIVLRDLRSPRDAQEGRAEVLSELPDSLGVAILDSHGLAVATRGAKVDWRGALATARPPLAADEARRLPTERLHPGAWRYLAPLRTRSGEPAGYLAVELEVRPPGWRALLGDSFEAPALIVYGLVFALGSALILTRLVTRRLRRFELTAEAWGRGDFAPRIQDADHDEIGRLGRRLDAMAGDLESLVALRSRLASLNERERLAGELHDTVKQKAFALQLQLAALRRKPELAAALEESRRITAEIQSALAALIDAGSEPAPGETDARPFSAELAERADTWARRGRFEISSDLSIADTVPLEQRPVLMRILDEALANVMRHSGARVAKVELQRRAGMFELRVGDDGRGLKQAAADGMGLAAMRRRAAELPQGRLALSEGAPGAQLSLIWAAETEAVR